MLYFTKNRIFSKVFYDNVFHCFRSPTNIWFMIITIGLVLFIMIPATWLYTLYKKYFSNKIQESNVFIRFIKYTARLVNSSIALRIVLYLTVSLLIAICTILDLVR